MTNTIVNFNPSSEGLAEISQNIDIRFALGANLSPTKYHQCTQFVKCRDFFCDEMYYAEYPAKEKQSIYGYKSAHDIKWLKQYKNSQHVPVFVINGAKTTIDPIIKYFNSSPVRKLEKSAYLDVPESEYSVLNSVINVDNTDVAVLHVHPVWFSTLTHFHFFTWILRYMCHKGTQTIQKKVPLGESLALYTLLENIKDDSEVTSVKNNLSIVTDFLMLTKRVPTDPLKVPNKTMSISTVHNYSGIMTFLKGITNYDFSTDNVGTYYAKLYAKSKL